MESSSEYSEWQKRPVPTFRVGGGGKGSRPLQEIIDAAPPFSRIIVLGGQYLEQLSLNKSLEITGDDGEEPSFVGRAPCLTVYGDIEARISRMTFRPRATGVKSVREPAAVLISGGRPYISGCEMTSMAVGGSAEPTVEQCTMSYNHSGCGLAIRDSASGVYRGNRIFQHATCCVEINSRGEPLLENNDLTMDHLDSSGLIGNGVVRIIGVGSSGLTAARPRLSGNRINDSMRDAATMDNAPKLYTVADLATKRSALFIDGQCAPLISDNIIIGGIVGIHVRDAAGTLERNQVQSTAACAVLFRDDARTEFVGNNVQVHWATGLMVSNARPLIKDNMVTNCRGSGLVCLDANGLRVTGNRIERNFTGCSIQGRGMMALLSNEIRNNEDTGVTAQGYGCIVAAERNNIGFNGNWGLRLSYGAGGVWSGNNIVGHKQGGLSLSQSANPTVEGNMISGNERFAIAVSDRANGTFKANKITGGSEACVVVSDGANPRFEANEVFDSPSAGFLLHEGGIGTLTANSIRSCRIGCQIRLFADPVVHSNNIQYCMEVGVLVEEEGLGTVTRNVVDNCTVGVKVHRGGECTIRGNEIRKSLETGIRLTDGCRGVVEKNFIHQNGNNIEVDGHDCEAYVQKNDIRDAAKVGVLSTNGAKGIIVDRNTSSGNRSAGYSTSGGGHSIFTRNVSLADKGPGILCTKGGLGQFKNNKVDRGLTRGCVVESGAAPIITSLLVTGTGTVGIDIASGAAGSLEDSTCTLNQIGIRFTGESKMHVRGLRSFNNSEQGCQIGEGAVIELQHCRFDSQLVGLAVRNSGKSTASKCSFEGNDVAVESTVNGTLTTVSECTFVASRICDVKFHQFGDMTVTQCQFIGAVGVLSDADGKGTVSGCTFTRNAVAGFRFDGRNSATGLSNCTFSECVRGIEVGGDSSGTVSECQFYACPVGVHTRSSQTRVMFAKCLFTGRAKPSAPTNVVAEGESDAATANAQEMLKNSEKSVSNFSLTKSKSTSTLGKVTSSVNLPAAKVGSSDRVTSTGQSAPAPSAANTDAVGVLAEGAGVFEECTFQSLRTGAIMGAYGKAHFTSCRFQESTGSGIHCREKSEGLFAKNEVVDTIGDGIVLELGSSTHFRGNLVVNASGSGLLALEGSGGLLQENTFDRNVTFGCRLKPLSAPRLEDNVIKGSPVGIAIEGSQAKLLKNSIMCNELGLDVIGRSLCLVEGNHITENQIGAAFLPRKAIAAAAAPPTSPMAAERQDDDTAVVTSFASTDDGGDPPAPTAATEATAPAVTPPAPQPISVSQVADPQSVSAATFKGNFFSVNRLCGVKIGDGSAPRLVANQFSQEDLGIELLAGAQGSLEQNVISECDIGVGLTGDLIKTKLLKNAFQRNATGVQVCYNAGWTLADNSFEGNTKCGVWLSRECTNAVVAVSHFKGDAVGVFAQHFTTGSVVSCLFESCTIGTSAGARATLNVSRNIFQGCELGSLYTDGAGEVVANMFYDAKVAGVCSEEDATPTVIKNQFAKCRAFTSSAGVLVRNSGGGAFEANDFHDNSVGYCSDAGSNSASVAKCVFHDHSSYGCVFKNGGRSQVALCIFASNKDGDILTTSQAAPTVTMCCFKGDSTTALVSLEGGGGTFSHCVALRQAGPTIKLVASGALVVTDWVISGSNTGCSAEGQPSDATVISRCVISGCAYGIASRNGGGASFCDVHISSCDWGVVLKCSGRCEVERVNVFKSTKGGVSVADTADPSSLRDCYITDCAAVGIQVHGPRCSTLFEGNVITNCRNNVSVGGGGQQPHRRPDETGGDAPPAPSQHASSTHHTQALPFWPVFRKNQSFNGDIGLMLSPEATGVFEENVVFSNRRTGLLCLAEKVTLKRNGFYSHMDDGAVVFGDNVPFSITHGNTVMNQFVPHWAKPDPPLPLVLGSAVSEANFTKEEQTMVSSLKSMYALATPVAVTTTPSTKAPGPAAVNATLLPPGSLVVATVEAAVRDAVGLPGAGLSECRCNFVEQYKEYGRRRGRRGSVARGEDPMEAPQYVPTRRRSSIRAAPPGQDAAPVDKSGSLTRRDSVAKSAFQRTATKIKVATRFSKSTSSSGVTGVRRKSVTTIQDSTASLATSADADQAAVPDVPSPFNVTSANDEEDRDVAPPSPPPELPTMLEQSFKAFADDPATAEASVTASAPAAAFRIDSGGSSSPALARSPPGPASPASRRQKATVAVGPAFLYREAPASPRSGIVEATSPSSPRSAVTLRNVLMTFDGVVAAGAPRATLPVHANSPLASNSQRRELLAALADAEVIPPPSLSPRGGPGSPRTDLAASNSDHFSDAVIASSQPRALIPRRPDGGGSTPPPTTTQDTDPPPPQRLGRTTKPAMAKARSQPMMVQTGNDCFVEHPLVRLASPAMGIAASQRAASPVNSALPRVTSSNALKHAHSAGDVLSSSFRGQRHATLATTVFDAASLIPESSPSPVAGRPLGAFDSSTATMLTFHMRDIIDKSLQAGASIRSHHVPGGGANAPNPTRPLWLSDSGGNDSIVIGSADDSGPYAPPRVGGGTTILMGGTALPSPPKNVTVMSVASHRRVRRAGVEGLPLLPTAFLKTAQQQASEADSTPHAAGGADGATPPSFSSTGGGAKAYHTARIWATAVVVPRTDRRHSHAPPVPTPRRTSPQAASLEPQLGYSPDAAVRQAPTATVTTPFLSPPLLADVGGRRHDTVPPLQQRTPVPTTGGRPEGSPSSRLGSRPQPESHTSAQVAAKLQHDLTGHGAVDLATIHNLQTFTAADAKRQNALGRLGTTLVAELTSSDRPDDSYGYLMPTASSVAAHRMTVWKKPPNALHSAAVADTWPARPPAMRPHHNMMEWVVDTPNGELRRRGTSDILYPYTDPPPQLPSS
mgnify:CR=1 FL=1